LHDVRAPDARSVRQFTVIHAVLPLAGHEQPRPILHAEGNGFQQLVEREGELCLCILDGARDGMLVDAEADAARSE
jgi:hypothetical protein